MIDEESSLLRPVQSNQSSPVESDRSVQSYTSLIALFIGAFLATADDAFLLVTHESIASEFQKLSYASFLLIAYNFGYSIALPVYGSISDIYDCKPLLLIAYCIFALGCLTSSVANSLWLVIVGRVASGIGGAGMIDLISVIITRLFDTTEMAALRSYVMTMNIIGRGVGGPLGGFLTDTIGWRWAFAVQVPLALMCMILGKIQLPTELPQAKSTSEQPSFRDIDYLGMATFAATIMSFILGLELGNGAFGWDSPIVIFLAAAFSAFGTAFILIEKYWARRPMIPSELISAPGVKSALLIQTLAFCGLFGFLSNLAPFFMRIEGISNTESAARIWAQSAGFASGAVLCSSIIKRVQRYKNLSIAAVGGIIASFLLITARWRDGANVWESMYTYPNGLSYGMFLAAQFVAVTLCVPSSYSGTGIGLYYLSQQVGMMVGITAGATFIQSIFRAFLEHGLSEYYAEEDKQHIIYSILQDIKFSQSLPKPVQELVRSGYLFGFQWLPVFAILCMLIVLPMVVYHREREMRKE